MTRKSRNLLYFCLFSVSMLLLVFLIQEARRRDANGIIFPRPFAVAIDDLGWNVGHNSGAGGGQGPFRLGLKRKMQLSDYQPIVEVAKELRVRLQGAFVLAEMDRENLLRRYPTTTEAGEGWDNSGNVGPEQIDIMAYVRDQAAFLEFGLHGVGHEYWPEPGKRRRGEWYNIEDDQPWSQGEMAAHIEAFKGIMAQYGLSSDDGHSFPESFVPCANGYHWNPDGEYSTGAMLRPEGVKFANTLLSYIQELDPPAGPNGGGIDHGLLVLNRLEYGNIWNQLSSVPTVPIEDQESDIIETHWSNFLAQDDFLQKETNEKWVDFFRGVQGQEDRYLAKNTEQFYSQWLYKKYTEVEEGTKGEVLIDNSMMPQAVYDHDLLSTLVLKVRLPEGRHISDAQLNARPIAVYYEDAGFGFIELPRLDAREYRLTYDLGETPPGIYIDHLGTYNIYSTEIDEDTFSFQARIYGTQEIHIHGLAMPENVVVDNERIRVLDINYHEAERLLILQVQAHDIQGETGNVLVEW